jgi:hypothetical protein
MGCCLVYALYNRSRLWLEKNTKKKSRLRQCSGRHLNLAPPEYLQSYSRQDPL